MKLLDGSSRSNVIKDELREEVALLSVKPKLVVCLVGDDPASKIYVGHKQKACEAVGIESEVISLPADTAEEELIGIIHGLSADASVTGVLVQLPLPAHMDEFSVLDSIHPSKDVDCLTPYNQGLLNLGIDFVKPCTPMGIIDLLQSNEITIAGKHAVVVGRSKIVGKPISQLLLQEDATVTVCHSKTENLEEHTRSADILIVAAGKKHLLNKDHLKDDVVVVDVGIHRDDNGLTGDVDQSAISGIATAASPVPGGVGPMTIASLLKNTLSLYYFQNQDLDED